MYRPLCLLNDIGKLLEYLLVRRIELHVEGKGGLCPSQFGFRRGKSTVDAAILLRETAQGVMNRYDMCMAVSLDIRNAFNFISWYNVLDALFGCSTTYNETSVVIFPGSGLSPEVTCSKPGIGEAMRIEVTCGVPQGSVIGPLLWIVTYDQVLRSPLPDGARLIGFADDTLVVATRKTSEATEECINTSLQMVVDKIHDLGLELAVEKTEVIVFRRNYNDRTPEIVIGGVNVNTKRSFNNLSMIVDDELNFKEHIKAAAEKGNKVLQALSRLLPNIGGPKKPRRRLLVSVVHSVLLYGAPVWGQCLKYSRGCVDRLMRVQRRAAIRSC